MKGAGRYLAIERGAFDDKASAAARDATEAGERVVPPPSTRSPIWQRVQMDADTAAALAEICGCSVAELNERYQR